MRKYALMVLLALVAFAPGCSRDEWTMTAPGLSEPEPISFALNAQAPPGVQDGWPVYITGTIVPGYLDNPATPDTIDGDSNILVEFGTIQNGRVNNPWSRYVWGTEYLTTWLWARDPATNRHYRMLDISLNGRPLTDSEPNNYWEVGRAAQLYVDDGEVGIQSGVPDSIMTVQFWYTGTAFQEQYLNWPARADNMVYWLGTWTTFRWAPHTTEFSDGKRTATFMCRRGDLALLRLQKETGDELRSGVYAGPVGDFSRATELKCIKQLGPGFNAFEFRVSRSGVVENPRPGDERKFGISIGGNP